MTEEAPKKRPVGRPSKYKPEYCERVLEMAAEGCSWAEYAAEFGIDRTTLYDWAAEFGQTIPAEVDFDLDNAGDPKRLLSAKWRAASKLWRRPSHLVATRCSSPSAKHPPALTSQRPSVSKRLEEFSLQIQ